MSLPKRLPRGLSANDQEWMLAQAYARFIGKTTSEMVRDLVHDEVTRLEARGDVEVLRTRSSVEIRRIGNG